MPALRLTQFQGEVMFLGLMSPEAQETVPITRLVLGFEGIEGDGWAGLTRPGCERVQELHSPGIPIANVRQLTILSEEEMAETAFAMRIPRLAPEWVGASVVLRGVPDLTHLPPSSRLQGPDGATIVVDMENFPSAQPGEVIEASYPGAGVRYRPAAQGRHGVTAWVERPGVIEIGHVLRLYIPGQRAWEQLSDARG